MIRELIREMLLQEDEATRRMNANLATHLATKVREPTDRRMFGRVLKDAWRKEADHASFNNVTFIHWQSFFSIAYLTRKPSGKDEISAIPYVKTPWKPFSFSSDNNIGAIIKGHPTLVANADLNSGAFKKDSVSPRYISQEKQDHRERSSGWNKYPGPKSPGSTPIPSDPGGQLARSWEDHLVYSASEIAPAEKINFDASKVISRSRRKRGDEVMGWPEALIDNWKIIGLVIPNVLTQKWGVEMTLEELKKYGVPAGIPIYAESGEEKSVTR